MNLKNYFLLERNRVFFLFLIVLLFIFYYTRKIITPIVIAAVLSYLTYPIYKKYEKTIKKKSLAAFLVVLQTTLIFILPLLYVVFQIIYNLVNFYKTITQNSEFLSELKLNLLNIVYNLVPYDDIRERIIQSFVEVTNNVFTYFSQVFVSFTSSLPILMVYLVIIVISQYYFLIYGKKIVKFLRTFMPFGIYNNIILENISKSIDNLIYGLIIPALAQSLALILILFLLKAKVDYFLIFIIGFIFAFIPSLGIWVVWLPLTILFLNNTAYLIIYLIYNLTITANVDFLVRILVTSKAGDVPVWIVIFSSFGGILTFGFKGMIISLFLSVFAYNLYKEVLTVKINKEELSSK